MTLREKVLAGLLVAFGLSALSLALLGDQGLREVRRLRAERDRLASEISQLRERSRTLEREVRSLRENPRVIEARARADLGMVRKGETVFIPVEHNGKSR